MRLVPRVTTAELVIDDLNEIAIMCALSERLRMRATHESLRAEGGAGPHAGLVFRLWFYRAIEM